MTVSRNTGIDHLDEPSRLLGTVITEEGFISASLGRPPFEDKDAFLHIGVPAGTPGIYVDKVGHYGATERELVLGRDLVYRVENVVQTEDSKWHIFVEVIESDR